MPDQTLIEPAALTADQAAKLYGISRGSFYSLWSSARVPSGFTLGKSRRWSRIELMAHIEAGCPVISVWIARQATVSTRERFSKLRSAS